MCGRYTLNSDREELISLFSLKENGNESSLYPRFNIAPSQKILAVTNTNGTNASSYFTWGLLPRWASNGHQPHLIINARAETAPSKITFSNAFRNRRCVIPATGYFEWFKTQQGKRQPILIYTEGEKCFGMAGLWEPPLSANSSSRCVIMTKEAKGHVSDIHSRMPLIIDPADYSKWLEINTPSIIIRDLLTSPTEITLNTRQVTNLVNSPKNDFPECIQAL